MKALVIDDCRSTRRVISSILSRIGFTVAEAQDGSDALIKLDEGNHPDVILVDWNMPQMNGIEFIRRIRRMERHENLPVMMVTSETEMTRMAVAFLAGADEYLMKPFDADMVQTKLAILGLRQAV